MSTNVSFADVHDRSLHPALSARAFHKSSKGSPVSDRARLHEPTRPTLKTDVIEYNTLKMTSHKHIDNAGGPLGELSTNLIRSEILTLLLCHLKDWHANYGE